MLRGLKLDRSYPHLPTTPASVADVKSSNAASMKGLPHP
jgi:hypothetical protein